MIRELRRTKIVITVGPATQKEEVFARLLEGGITVCRFNMAHADHDWFRETVESIRQWARAAGKHVALMMDVKGPEVRTRDVAHPIELDRDDVVEFYYQEDPEAVEEPPQDGQPIRVGVNYEYLADDLTVGQTMVVDSGLIRLAVEETSGGRARCKVITAGTLTSRRHINLPGVLVRLPPLTEKDMADIRVGVEQGVDLFALSFVRQASDISALRDVLDELGSPAGIIAKIEEQSGVANLDAILELADGVMVARGDLGIEVPLEQLPIIQRRAVEACIRAGKPTIIATQMLESMIQWPVPTRAEVTDVSNAVREQADCVMLSGETSTGKYPERCLDVLNRVIFTMQREPAVARQLEMELPTPKKELLRSAVALGEGLGGAGIIVFTQSGDLARWLSSMRPKNCPIFAFTDNETTYDRLMMLWGVEPFMMPFRKTPELTIHAAFDQLKETDWAEVGDPMIVVTNVLVRKDKIVDSLQVRELE